MPFTTNAFLEALDLPSDHPYIRPIDNVREEAKKEWSISSYFTSVAWAKDSKSSGSKHECEEFPKLSWAKWPLSRGDAIIDACSPNIPSPSAAISNSSASAVETLQEITPCLVSMVRMNIIVWAPLVVIFCLKRLYHVQKRDLREFTPHQMNCSEKSEQKKSSSEITGYFVAMSTLPSYLPSSLCKVTMAHDKQKRQTPEPYQQNNNSFERLLLLLSIFVNMASFSALFSLEEKKEEQKEKEINTNESRDDDRLSKHHRTRSYSIDNLIQGPFVITSEWLAYAVALIFTAVVMDDAQYVLAYPQSHLVALHFFVISVSLKRLGSRVSLVTAVPITAIALYIMASQDLDLPIIKPGLYYDETNPVIAKTVSEWPVDKRTYDDGRGTPWMMTGDTRTGMPFMVNTIPEVEYVRRWVPLPDENEAVILDIAFPESMVIGNDKLVYLILHGINGDSNEGYVADFVTRQLSKGNIVAVMITRGLGDSPIIGDNILHFARTSDVGAAARALKKAINQVSPNGMLLAGVGYSMGAITLANYVSQVNPPDLDVAIAFSGALDTKEQVHFVRSAHLWQPFIAKAMRDTMFGRYSRQIRNKLGEEQVKEVMKSKSLVDFDRTLFVPYNDFESLDDYYSKLGAMGDFDLNGYEGRISQVSIPLLCVHSLDDPIGSSKSFHDPTMVSKSGNGYTMLLFTRTGGHVGWPLGWNPAKYGWSWMSDTASSFAESVHQVHSNQRKLL